MKTFKQFITEAKSNTIPPIVKSGKELVKLYPDTVQKAMDDMLKTFGYGLKDEYKNTLTIEKYADELISGWYSKDIDYNDDKILSFALENKDKIINRLKRAGWKGKELEMYFWMEFKYFYRDYKNKLESEERKRIEREQREQRQREREEKRSAKLSYTMIKDIFDKGPKDLVWKSLLELKERNRQYFLDIRKKYKSLNKDASYYIDEIKSKGSKYIKMINANDSKYRELYMHIIDDYHLEDISIALLNDKELDKALQTDIEIKYADLIKRVTDKIGTHIEGVKLKNSVNGSVNGYIISDSGKVNIDTILAWGEIRRPHYRVLVK